MPLMTYYDIPYFWMLGVGCPDVLGPQRHGYCSECEKSAKLENVWFLIQPKECEHCGHKFGKLEPAYSKCDDRYEYARKLVEKWDAEEAKRFEERNTKPND